MDKPRISFLAISSLVAGMAFFIPIVTGLAAILLGAFSVKSINKSQGMLLGKGLAYTGIGLGAVHGTFWLLIFYAGLTYLVDVGQSAVVLRGGDVQRVEKSGLHYKIPFIESVEYYPTETVQLLESNTEALLFSSRETHSLDYKLQWKICAADKAYIKYGPFKRRLIEELLSVKVKNALRNASAHKSNSKELITDYTILKDTENDLNNNLKDSGVCVVMLTLISSEE